MAGIIHFSVEQFTAWHRGIVDLLLGIGLGNGFASYPDHEDVLKQWLLKNSIRYYIYVMIKVAAFPAFNPYKICV